MGSFFGQSLKNTFISKYIFFMPNCITSVISMVISIFRKSKIKSIKNRLDCIAITSVHPFYRLTSVLSADLSSRKTRNLETTFVEVAVGPQLSASIHEELNFIDASYFARKSQK